MDASRAAATADAAAAGRGVRSCTEIAADALVSAVSAGSLSAMRCNLRSALAAIAVALSALSPVASAQTVVFDVGNDLGFFAPINSSNAATVKYGDGGWLGPGPGAPGVTLSKIKLRLATFGSKVPGSTDIEFTLNNGDPSGLVFGPGTPLYTTTITGVELPASSATSATFFEIDIPLPNIRTTGGFNNVGWSVKCRNFNYQGQFGFQVATCNEQFVGFYTNNASFFNGSFWSLFAFGQDPCTQVANFSVTLFKAPCSGDIDLNGSVDAADLASILAAWFSSGKGLPEDLNGDGSVDAADLSALLANWGACL
jgi:hypothetical protein